MTWNFSFDFQNHYCCSSTDTPVVCVSVWYGEMLYISIYISTVWTIFFILIVSVHYVNSSPINGICQLKTSFQSVQHTEKKPIFSKPNMCMHLKYLFAVLIYSWFSHYLSHTIRKLSSVQGACFFQIIIIFQMRDFVIQFNRLQPSIIHDRCNG